ncbi:glycerate kinase [Blastococcus aurantiacus]|uniref:Glycerate kinase n=1 Tax=Blastococcus aurantiacus TaxID=1550231 RepID=A0A1G7HXR6_9ACTN|nr:glycerate kinase [Blastococcus aurantiacus]SDF05143.1 glycerate kinase [Blastococcus aurantiacus]
MRVLLAPDSFKGSATAGGVAAALRDGWLSERASDEVVLAPMADGGEGTLDAFAAAVPGARRVPLEVDGPDGRRVRCSWLRLPDGTGVVELAAASGLPLMRRPDAFAAHTLGFGQAIASALDKGVDRLLLALGGSASTDGGTGLLTALGARFLDRAGRQVPLGNAGLAVLDRIDLTGLRPLPSGGATVLGDVDAPLLGPSGAAAVFGPQKGARPADVPVLEAGLERLAGLTGGDPAEPGTGAAGGAGFGLRLWGATMATGAAAVGDAVDLPRLVSAADLVVTGEGRYDEQSAAGKVPSYVQDLARRAGTPTLLVAGSITTGTEGFAATASLVDVAGDLPAALQDPTRWLRRAAADLACRYPTAP